MKNRNTNPQITSLAENEIFVFGSNLEGMHGGGAAYVAARDFGAVMGQGVGRQGRCYAIPTMQGGIETIRPYVEQFIRYAAAHAELDFLVTRVGCGIAGFSDSQIAPLFAECRNLENVALPKEFWEVIGGERRPYYNSGHKEIRAANGVYPGIETPDDLYDALLHCWTRETCTERLRSKFSEENKTAGQCAITAFIVQDIFGGEIHEMDTGRGLHCYNVIGGVAIDLTSGQFGEEAESLSYKDNPVQPAREERMSQTQKRERYELLKKNLREWTAARSQA